MSGSRGTSARRHAYAVDGDGSCRFLHRLGSAHVADRPKQRWAREALDEVASARPSTESRISSRRPETVRTGGSSMRKLALPGIGAAVPAVALAFASGGAAAGPPGYE